MEQNHGMQAKDVGDKLCAYCEKNPVISPSFFCSVECYSASRIGSHHSWGDKISKALKGKPKSAQHVERVRQALIGKKRPDMAGPKNNNWKGNKAMYGTLHDWVSLHLGRPKKCSKCGKTDKDAIYQWANISGKYLRNLKDYKRLCVQCHRAEDKNIPRAAKIYNKHSKQGIYTNKK
jgi:hypothetical protein